MNRSWLGLLAALGWLLSAAPSFADTPVQATVLTTCGTMNYPVGQARTMTQDHTGTLCTAGGGGGGGVVTGNQSNASGGTTGSANVGVNAYGYVWNGSSWVQETQPGSGTVTITGPLGTQTIAASVAVTQASGADVTLGALTDTAGVGASSTVKSNILQLHTDATAAVPVQAQSAEPAAATTNNPAPAWGDLFGKLVTSPYAPRNIQLTGYATTNANTATTLKAAQGAGVKIYVTDLVCTRNDAGTTAITITLDDVNTTVIDLPNNGGGGGYSHTYNVPLVIAANTAFTYTPGSSITSVHCHFSGFSGA